MSLKERGLKEEEAKRLLDTHGKNEIEDVGRASTLGILFRQIKNNFVVYLLLIAMAISFFVGKDITGYVLLCVIVLVIVLGFIQEYKAETAINALKSMIMPISIVIRDGEEREAPSNQLVPGDIIILRNGEKIPADCIVLTETELSVDESILTGESREIKKYVVKDEKKYEDKSTLFMGSFVVNGKCTTRIIHTGMNTKFGKIAGMISKAEKELPLQNKVNKIAKYMTAAGASMAILTGLILLLKAPVFNYELLVDVLIIVIALAVASFPEGFPVVLITALASGSYKMAKKNAIVNRMSIIETLGETTVICSDKTGTITKGEMTVKKIVIGQRIYDVTGVGYEAKGDFLLDKNKVDAKKDEILNLLLKSSVICNDTKISRTGEDKIYKPIGSPTEAALLIMSAKAGIFKEDLKFEIEKEVPFSSERKLMSLVVKEGREKMLYSKGAAEIVLSRCKFIRKNDGVFTLTERERENILEANKKMTSDAFRTLGIAYKNSGFENVESDLIFIGIVAMEDPPREEVKEALELCKKAGIKVKMITGDSKETAIAIAKQIGLKINQVVEGKDLDNLTDKNLAKIINEITIFARVKPEHKLRIVQTLKANGEIVTMTGDGVNDAPSLKEAHIGVAMGKNGTDVSRSVADLTLKNDNFATIVDAVKEGRTVFTNIQKFATYQISINIAQVSLIFLAVLLRLPTPLVAIQILFMNLFSDEITAITIAFNPYSKDVMSLKPRKRSDIVTKPLLMMILISGLMMCIFALSVFYFSIKSGVPEPTARTITFVTMVLLGLANAFNYRSFRKPTLARSPFTNKPLVLASLIAIVATALIVYSPFSGIFETVHIPVSFFLVGVLASIFFLLIFDVLKVINEKKHYWSEDMQDFEINNKNHKIRSELD